MLWPDEEFALPQREADFGKAQERSMSSIASGYGGIRTVEFVNPDGSIERLRTRNGWPIFEKDSGAGAGGETPAADLARGFVAKVPGGRAVLFNPYTLAILNPQYTLAKDTYTVQDFATTWNVPAGDTTHWYDVVLFDGTTVKVNAKAMGSLLVTGNHGYQAIPYVINRNDASDQYGNAERNTSEKRVFAVGRYQVNSWGGGGTSQALTPTTPRSDDKAMTIGQRLDFSLDKAWLGQLYYSGAAWDSIGGEWYFTGAAVTMLLASPYLSKVASSANVVMSPPALSNLGASSGFITTDMALPSGAEISLVGTPVNDVAVPYSRPANGAGGNNGQFVVHWPWSGVLTAALQGENYSSYTRSTYGGAASSTEVAAGISLEYAANNNKIWDSRIDQPRQKTYGHSIAAHSGSSNGSDLSATLSTLYWGQYAPTGWDPSQEATTRGRTVVAIEAQFIPGGTANRDYEEQTGSFSVTAGANTLVSGNYIRNQSSGQKPVFAPNTGYYDAYFLSGPGYAAGWVTIYGYAGVGMGAYGRASLQAYSDPSTDLIPVYDVYKNPTQHNQDSSATAEINAKYGTGVTAYMGQTMYDNEQSDGYTGRIYYHTVSIASNVTLGDQTLIWNTKDYLLYDDTNGVYIWIEGIFSGTQTYGSNAAAGLTVNLKVQTRFHTTTQTLGNFTYSYSTLLPETQIGSTGKYAVPSPQIRAIFAPLYQEQGSFKGAHYVTQLEESNGSPPFHGFNFILKLRMYGDLPTVNADNDSYNEVYFVPCNLLEMLYCFVFSQEYGVAESGERYPVDYTTRFNDLQSTLFSTPVRVTVRNGVAGNWTDPFGADFASVGNISLHRT